MGGGVRMVHTETEEEEENRCRANMAHLRLSRPDSGLGFQAHVLKPRSHCWLFARQLDLAWMLEKKKRTASHLVVRVQG